MALLALIEQECKQSNGFRNFNVTSRASHDDFADQPDDIGIGAPPYPLRKGETRSLYVCRQTDRRQDLST
jgi:hypothetical protein